MSNNNTLITNLDVLAGFACGSLRQVGYEIQDMLSTFGFPPPFVASSLSN